MTFDVNGWIQGPNGHNKGGGFTIVDESNKLLCRIPIRKRNITSSEVELWAVAGAVHLAHMGDIIRSDSQVISRYWVPAGRCKARPDLNALCQFAHDGIHDKRLTLVWIPRAQNLAGIVNDKHK